MILILLLLGSVSRPKYLYCLLLPIWLPNPLFRSCDGPFGGYEFSRPRSRGNLSVICYPGISTPYPDKPSYIEWRRTHSYFIFNRKTIAGSSAVFKFKHCLMICISIITGDKDRPPRSPNCTLNMSADLLNYPNDELDINVSSKDCYEGRSSLVQHSVHVWTIDQWTNLRESMHQYRCICIVLSDSDQGNGRFRLSSHSYHSWTARARLLSQSVRHRMKLKRPLCIPFSSIW